MSTPTNQHDSNNPENTIAIAQRVGGSWRCLFATTDDSGQPTILDALELVNEKALADALHTKQPTATFCILPGSATVCRTTTLPDVEDEQIAEALRLQAESKFLGGTPEHRRAMSALDTSIGETNRVGLIVAWPETSTLDIPDCLHDVNFIPDAGAIAALLDGLRPTEPLLYADPADGTVTIALSHANGAALRATREDATDEYTFREGIVRITRETASAHNHTSSFTDSLVNALQTELTAHSFADPLLILPDVIRDDTAKRVQGTADCDTGWWSTWGILIGGLLATTGSLQPLTTMRATAPELHPSATEKILNRCNNGATATKLAILAVLVLAFGPAVLSGLKLSLLTILNPTVEARYSEVVEARKEQILYKELAKKAWPMTKLTADVINNVPIGIDIEMLKLNVGEAISVRGRALSKDGKTAAELIAKMQEKLQKTGMFTDIQFSYEAAGTYGDRKFVLGATVTDPLRRPRYTQESDYGLWTVAMRNAGLQPEEKTEFVEQEVPISEPDGSSLLGGANEEMGENAGDAPLVLNEDPDRVIRDRPIRGGGASDAGSRASERNSGGEGSSARVPEPLTAEQIALMGEAEARVALSEVAVGRKHSRGDEEVTKRLKNESRMLIDRLKELAK
ncbi:MAG: hypothetical protein HOC27_00600 [Phycisphaerae bacterium]|jgi:hypothetical protein|nr:hypothetical protein [Phycisphaerae bacterium]